MERLLRRVTQHSRSDKYDRVLEDSAVAIHADVLFAVTPVTTPEL